MTTGKRRKFFKNSNKSKNHAKGSKNINCNKNEEDGTPYDCAFSLFNSTKRKTLILSQTVCMILCDLAKSNNYKANPVSMEVIFEPLVIDDGYFLKRRLTMHKYYNKFISRNILIGITVSFKIRSICAISLTN